MSDTTLTHKRVFVNTGQWSIELYGSRHGLVYTIWHQFLYASGYYRSYTQVEWPSIERLVFVCKGNICLGAHAEVVVRSLVLHTIFCGIDTIENAQANRSATLEANNYGFNLEEHKTTSIMYLTLKKSDLLGVMEPWQCEFLACHLQR